MMFYLQDIEGNWHTGKEIHLPNGSIISEKETTNKYGWQWLDEPPKEYLDWIKKQKNNEDTNGDI